MKIHFSPRFISEYLKLIKKQPSTKKTFERALILLKEKFNPPSLKVHKLSGRLKDHWAFSLTYNLRVTFKLEKETVILTHIGTHDEVYR